MTIDLFQDVVLPVRFPEIGCYTLPGRAADLRPVLDEVREAEALGLGSV